MAPRVHTFGPADGAPLVAVHGTGGHGRRSREFVTAQLPRHRVYAPDLRGLADPTGEPPWTLERHALDVLDIVNGHNPSRPVLMGHSFGAVVAVYAARRAPGRIAALVLLDPAPTLPGPVASRMAHAALDAPAFNSPDGAARDLIRTWPREAHALVDEEVRTRLVRANHSPAVEQFYVDRRRVVLGDRLTFSTMDCGHQITMERPAQAGRLIRELLDTASP